MIAGPADAPTGPAGVQPGRPPQRRSGRASVLLCWIILAAAGVGMPIYYAVQAHAALAPVGTAPATQGAPSTQPATAHPATTQPVGGGDTVDFQTEVTGKYIIGAVRALHQPPALLVAQMSQQAKSPEQKIAVGIVTADLEDKSAGLRWITQSGSADSPAFEAFYHSHTPLPAEFAERYGFLFRLANSFGQPDSSPQRAAILAESRRVIWIGGVVVGVLSVAVILGIALLVTAVVLMALGKLRLRVGRPAGPAHVYVEAFTIYLVGLVVGPLILNELLPETSYVATLALHLSIAFGGIAIGFLWPLLRGVPWRVQRADWGITAGRNPLIEIVSGIGGYLAGLPVMGLGLIVTALLMRSADVSVSHPIVQQVAHHPYLVLLLASIFAPLNEELFFRGGLLSHLRGRLGPFVSAGITALLFASMHPQGWAGIPVLASIGFVLAMIRQWRGSLLASMTAHALNNTAVMIVVMMIS